MAGFSWAAAADVGTGVASAISAWGSASANRTVTKANAEAQRVVREAQNKQRASATSLAGVMRSQAYRAALTNAGMDSSNAGETIARTQEAWTRQNLEQGLRGSEQLGAFAARAAASGMGGASIRAVSYSMELQQARLAERTQERQQETMYELVKQRTGIMPAAVSRLDLSPLSTSLDYSPSVPQGGNSANLLGYLMQGVLGKSKSLQVALDSIEQPDTTQLPTGDFARMDRMSPIMID